MNKRKLSIGCGTTLQPACRTVAANWQRHSLQPLGKILLARQEPADRVYSILGLLYVHRRRGIRIIGTRLANGFSTKNHSAAAPAHASV